MFFTNASNHKNLLAEFVILTCLIHIADYIKTSHNQLSLVNPIRQHSYSSIITIHHSFTTPRIHKLLEELFPLTCLLQFAGSRYKLILLRQMQVAFTSAAQAHKTLQLEQCLNSYNNSPKFNRLIIWYCYCCKNIEARTHINMDQCCCYNTYYCYSVCFEDVDVFLLLMLLLLLIFFNKYNMDFSTWKISISKRCKKIERYIHFALHYWIH